MTGGLTEDERAAVQARARRAITSATPPDSATLERIYGLLSGDESGPELVKDSFRTYSASVSIVSVENEARRPSEQPGSRS